MRQKAKIGDRVRDRVTSLEGIVTGYHQWITGCDTCSVQPAATDGKLSSVEHFDVWRLDVLEAGAVPPDSVRDPGLVLGESGEHPAPRLPGGPSDCDIAALSARR